MNAHATPFMAKLRLRGRPARAERPLTPHAISEKFCEAFENLGLGGVWSSDCDGNLTFLSQAILNLLEVKEQPFGLHFCALFASGEEDCDAVRNLRLALTRRTKFCGLDVPFKAGGQTRWCALSGEAQFDQGGRFLGFLGFWSDITDDRQVAEETAQLAMHDPLTGLLNRRRMTALLERMLLSFKHQQRSCATMLIDLDRFKQVNDTLGHSSGDTLLKQVAERLVTIVGDREKVCRLGGDEFQVMLTDCDDRAKLAELAGRIITMLSQPYSVDGTRCLIGASVGIAISPFDGEEIDELMRNADLALYAAKHSGRGRFNFFTAELLKAAEKRRMLEQDLHDALQRGEFELYYQPVVSTLSNQVTGAEALVRWNHPEQGQISPAAFIPIAEESNLICRLGEWILRQGCAEAAKWATPLRVAINVSPVQFVEPGFPGIVAQALAASGLAPERLELEITEGVFLAGDGTTEETFAILKRLGVRLALDDFGTGYSSLAYLKSAPFDKIKIDQSFVRGATVDGSRNRAIIHAIVSLADALDMETTAEGVETFDQLAMVRELGVSHIQGYIYSKPIAEPEFRTQSCQAEWGIEPSGYATQRHPRITMYRKIGAIHDDHYYTVMLRNLSASGALVEGLIDVPVDTQFVLDFGDGQLEVATVKRSGRAQLGVEFENQLVDDGAGGLCTRSRVSPHLLAAAGLPDFASSSGPLAPVGQLGVKLSGASFISAADRRAIITTRVAG